MPNATSHRRPTLSTGARWTILISLIFLLLGLGAVGYGYWRATERIEREHTVKIDASWAGAPAGDPVRGRRFVNGVVRCGECHGPDLGGKVVVDSALGRIVAPNITPGAPTVQAYGRDDWLRAIRHGVSPQSRGLWLMPVERFGKIGRQDLADMVAYLTSARPVQRQLDGSDLSLFGMTLVGYDRVPLILAEDSGPPAAFPNPPHTQASPEYGAYLAAIAGCAECHGDGLVGMAHEMMRAPALVGGDAAGWSLEQWRLLLRSGERPGGGGVDDNRMPIRDYMLLSDLEIEALWRFVKAAR